MQTSHDYRQEANVLECAACGHGPVVLDPGSTVTCSGCCRSHVPHVGEGFSLVETVGWTTHAATGRTVLEADHA